MQTGKQQRWVITILVCMVAVAVVFTAYATKDLWSPSSTSDQSDSTGNGQDVSASTYNDQSTGANQSTGADNSASSSGGDSSANQSVGADNSANSRGGHSRAAASAEVSPTVAADVSSTVAAAPTITATADLSATALAKPGRAGHTSTAPAQAAVASANSVATDTLEIPGTAITSQPAVVGANGAQLLDAPRGKVVASLMTGTLVEALASSGDQGWIKVQSGDNSGQGGWIEASQLLLADPTTLPTDGPASAPVSSTVPAAITALLQEAQGGNGGAVATPSSQPQASPAVQADPAVQATINSGSSHLNVRSGPGTNDAILAAATAGEQYPVIGRSSDGSWLEINTATGSAASSGAPNGWVSAAYVTLTGDINSVPVVGQ